MGGIPEPSGGAIVWTDSTVPDAYAAIPRAFNAAAYFVDRHVDEGRGDRIALVHGGREITYAAVHASVNRCGTALASLGVRRADRVALLLPDGPELVYGFWGAIKIGAVPVPVNTMLRPREHDHVLADCAAGTLVASPALVAALDRSRLPALRHVVVARSAAGAPPAGGERAAPAAGSSTGQHHVPFDELLASADDRLQPAPTDRDDPAFWLYTSGTTGAPKGVVHLQHDMSVCCAGYARHVLEITPDDRCLSVAKLFFAYGLGNALYYPFEVGASAILQEERFDPVAVFELVDRHRPTLLFAVPTAFAAMLRVPDVETRYDTSSLRLCLSAGEPLPAALYRRWLERFGVEILDGIGSTEMCHTFICNRRGRVRPGSSGTLVPGYDARIVDEHGREVLDGQVGDLLVKGHSAFVGYWNQEERTRRTVQGEWVRTGDRYRKDADGYFWHAGRSDDMIRASGMWVSPVEVEAALVEHPAVVEAGVVGAAGEDGLVKPLAFVVLAGGHAPAETLAAELKELVRARLASHKCPRWVVFVPELPKTATGKIQRFRLRQLAAEGLTRG